MNNELQRILGDSIEVDGAQVPVASIFYEGDSKTYVVWTIIDEAPALSADDVDEYSAVTVDIDIYSPNDFRRILSAVKALMHSNGWIWSGDSPDMYERDTELYHKTTTYMKERFIL